MGAETYRNFTNPYSPTPDPNANSSSPNSPYFQFATGYTTASECEDFLNSSNPARELPCSLTNTNIYNVQDPSWTYIILGAGINNNASDIGNTNFTLEAQREDAGSAVGTQVTTYLVPNSTQYHSFLFYIDAAQQTYGYAPESKGPVYFFNGGYDFVAPTYSMQTSCAAVDTPCNLMSNSSLYNCSSIFAGNLTQEPSGGRQKVPGWNSTFCTLESGIPREITTGEEQNPFHFNITASVDSLSDQLSSLSPSDLPAPLVQTDEGIVSFALSCNATVYAVNLTFLNSAITNFNTALASPRIASIVRAPLQVGYGRYNLYQSAISAVLGFGSEPVESAMGRAFSQVAIALSSGAFNYTTNILQRERWDVEVTRVPKPPVWFLATVCALYALLALGAFGTALVFRRDEGTREVQRRLGLEDVNVILKKAMEKYLEKAEDECLKKAEEEYSK